MTCLQIFMSQCYFFQLKGLNRVWLCEHNSSPLRFSTIYPRHTFALRNVALRFVSTSALKASISLASLVFCSSASWRFNRSSSTLQAKSETIEEKAKIQTCWRVFCSSRARFSTSEWALIPQEARTFSTSHLHHKFDPFAALLSWGCMSLFI